MWSGEKQPQFLLAFDKQACNKGTARLEKKFVFRGQILIACGYILTRVIDAFWPLGLKKVKCQEISIPSI